MTPEKAEELIRLCEAHSSGKIIEYYSIVSNKWIEDKHFGFNVMDLEYRIKPESKLIPFTLEDNKLFRDKWFRKKGGTYLFTITKIMNSGVLVPVDYWTSHNISFGELLEQFEFEDGSPFGKYVNE